MKNVWNVIRRFLTDDINQIVVCAFVVPLLSAVVILFGGQRVLLPMGIVWLAAVVFLLAKVIRLALPDIRAKYHPVRALVAFVIALIMFIEAVFGFAGSENALMVSLALAVVVVFLMTAVPLRQAPGRHTDDDTRS